MQAPIRVKGAYALKCQARCIAGQQGDVESSRWLVGTLSVRDENEVYYNSPRPHGLWGKRLELGHGGNVHLVQLGENNAELICKGLYPHQNEIWDLAACPFESSFFSTVYSKGIESGTTVWKIPEQRGGGLNPGLSLQNVSSLPGQSQRLKCTLWWPSGKHRHLVSVGGETLIMWDIGAPQKFFQASLQREPTRMEVGCWDPHDVTRFATATDVSVHCWDLRSMSPTIKIEQAHSIQLHHMDFNPKKQHLIATAGDDSRIRIWDLKMPNLPLQELRGHHHWTVRVRYNSTYDELLLSSGTDNMVNLWRVRNESESKSALGSPRPFGDGSLLRSYIEYEDSVYGIAWSTRDPWIFASVCYNGRVLVDSVPMAVRKKVQK